MTTRQVQRKRHTQAQRDKILQDYRRRQLPQRELAAQAGIGLSTLQLWLRKAGRRSERPAARFIEVPNPLSAAPAGSTYRVHLAGDLQLEVGPGFRPEELTSLLRVLRGL